MRLDVLERLADDRLKPLDVRDVLVGRCHDHRRLRVLLEDPVRGVGDAKARRYGKEFLAAIQKYRDENLGK